MYNSHKIKYILNFVSPNEDDPGRRKWMCDKCQKIFSTWKEVRLHKRDVHSY